MRRRINIKTIFLGYFLLSFSAFIYLTFHFDDAESAKCAAKLVSLQKLMEKTIESNSARALKAKEHSLLVLERKLTSLEVQLRRQYPKAVGKIAKESARDLPTIYAITPTYARPVQKAELTRLSQTFLHVKNFHWIVVEDSSEKTDLVARFLADSGLTYTQLNVATDPTYKLKNSDPHWLKPKGVEQRNLGIEWLRSNVDAARNPSTVYFADDDNTYDLKIFEEMRGTEKVSVWPVGLTGGLRFERPLVSSQGKVTGWYAAWKPQRPFAMDMAGFAVNLKLLVDHPEANFDLEVMRGYVESSLLTKLVTLDELEPKADLCTKVYVWHVRTERPKWKDEKRLASMGQPSDPRVET